MSRDYFKEALADFTVDFASGGAIRVMADKGYTVREIHDKLDFPVPMEKIAELVWKRYLETGVIRMEAPDKGDASAGSASDGVAPTKRVTYEKVQDEYGRTSFRQVVVETGVTEKHGAKSESGTLTEREGANGETAVAEYVLCDFGKRKYQDPVAFEKSLEALSPSDKDYVTGLPWPLQNVWHIKNERMRRIEAIKC